MSLSKTSILVTISFLLLLLSSIGLYFIKTNPLSQKKTVSLLSSHQNIDNFCLAENCFTKNGDLWFINQTIPADSNQVNNFLSKCLQTSLDNVFSNNPDNFNALAISDDLAIPFTIDNSTYQLSSKLINLSYNLIKLTDQDIVYKIDFLIDPSDLESVDYWLVKYLQNIPQYQITTLQIASQSQTKSYQKDSKDWPQDEILSTIAYLPAGQFLGQTKPETDTDYQLISTVEDGSQSVLTLAKSNQEIYWASNDNHLYYQIDKSDFDKLTSLLK